MPELIQDIMLDEPEDEHEPDSDESYNDSESEDQPSENDSKDSEADDSSIHGGHEDAAGTEEEWFDGNMGGGGDEHGDTLPSDSENTINMVVNNSANENKIESFEDENFDGYSDDSYEAVGGFDNIAAVDGSGNIIGDSADSADIKIYSGKIYSGDDSKNEAAMTYMLTPQQNQNITNSIINPASTMISNPDIKVIDISSTSTSKSTNPTENNDETFDGGWERDEFFEDE
jgi:hypothetical protein